MKARFLLLLAIIVIAQCAIAADKDAASVIAALENKWAEAQKMGDAGAVAPLLHENFISTDVSGHSYNKQQLLATLKGGKWESNAISEVLTANFNQAFSFVTSHHPFAGIANLSGLR